MVGRPVLAMSGGTGPNWSTTAFQREPDIPAFEVRFWPHSRPFAAPRLATAPDPTRAFAAHEHWPQSSIPLIRPLSARITLVTMVAKPANSRMATIGRLMNTHMS